MKHLKKAERTNRPKGWEYINEDEVNSQNILGDKNYQASSLKFRQIPIIMSAIFNSNPCSTILFLYSSLNASDDITTFNNILFSLVRLIAKHNALIISGYMNAQRRK